MRVKQRRVYISVLAADSTDDPHTEDPTTEDPRADELNRVDYIIIGVTSATAAAIIVGSIIYFVSKKRQYVCLVFFPDIEVKE